MKTGIATCLHALPQHIGKRNTGAHTKWFEPEAEAQGGPTMRQVDTPPERSQDVSTTERYLQLLTYLRRRDCHPDRCSAPCMGLASLIS